MIRNGNCWGEGSVLMPLLYHHSSQETNPGNSGQLLLALLIPKQLLGIAGRFEYLWDVTVQLRNNFINGFLPGRI